MTLEWETPIYNDISFLLLYEPGDPYMKPFWNSSYFNYPWKAEVVG